jgi:hypothetical protein
MSDIPTGYPGAPPGWYPDPAGGPGQRWWDGYAWTDAVVLPTPPPPPPQWAANPGHPNAMSQSAAIAATPYLLARELALLPVARLALGFFGVDYLVGLINTRLHLSQLRTEGHQLRLIYRAAEHGQPSPTFSNPQSIDPLQAILLLVFVVAVIFGCMWQFRAATAARSLGLPSRHSPGWGVGSWFVPVVNLWMPYQAIRDCLPPDDPNRRLVLQWWLSLLSGEVLVAAATSAAFFSGTVSLVLSIPAALVALSIVATGPRVASAIGLAHRGAPSLPGTPTQVSG